MDFRLTEEQKMLKKMVRDLAEREFQPRAAYWDEHEEFPWENVRQMAALGLLGLTIPPEYGGQGRTIFEVVLVIEEIAKVCRNTSTILVTQVGDAEDIREHGSPDLKARLLPAMAQGEKIGCICISEPQAGSDVAALRTTAERDGDYYVVNGLKHFITNGLVADIFVTFVRFGKESKGANGIGSLVIERGMPGLSFGKNDRTMGVRGCSHPEVIFQDCRVPRDNVLVLGEPDNNNGFRTILRAFNRERCFNAANCLGTAQGVLEAAIAYSQQREAFGRKICEFQGLQWMLADMAIKVEAARWLLYRAAVNAGLGAPDVLETSLAKTFANEIAFEVANAAMQIHGGYGYLTEFPLERALRDVRVYSFGAGTTQIQRNMIAHELLRGGLSRIAGR